MPGKMLLRFYEWVGYLALPILAVVLLRRIRRGKEDPARWRERFGNASKPRPDSQLTWVHAASVGEMNAAMDVISALIADGGRVILTTGTLTSAQLAREQLPDGATHAFAPLDAAPAVRRFLRHWHPDLALFVESEVWPGMLAALKRRRIPTLLINARMSERSAKGWLKIAGFASAVFGCIDEVLASSPADAVRFAAIGAKPVALTGNLKYDRAAPEANANAVDVLTTALGARPAIVAVSTHGGEENILLTALQQVRAIHAKAVLVVVPRHPDRGGEISQQAKAAGLVAHQRSAQEPMTADSDVYIMDTLGEVGLAVQLSPFVIMGGSLVDRGGQNPIEAASLGRFVLHGAKVQNFRETYRALNACGGAEEMSDETMVADAIIRCLDHPQRMKTGGQAGQKMVQAQRGALARTLASVRARRSKR